MDIEQRGLLRWPVNWQAKIRIKYQNTNKNFNCCVKNINFKGVQLILEKKLPDIQVLKFTIVLPENINLPLQARLTAHETMEGAFHLYSFQIIRMKDSDKDLLYRLINKNYFAELLKLWWEGVK